MNVIEIEGITKTYHMGKIDVPVLHGVSLEIRQGEFVAVMGASGSGKSTLLHLLGLLDKPDGGTYRLAGREVSRLSDNELAQLRNTYIGYVFQQFNLLPRLSAKDNVALPTVYADGAGADDAGRLLERVGLADRSGHRPGELSGGQQQRVAIARALVNAPLLILADEPTGNLDTRSAAEIIALLKELNRSGITVIMVTHEPDIAGEAERIIRLQDGVIVSDERTRGASSGDAAAGGSDGDGPSRPAHSPFSLRRVKDYFLQAGRSLVSNKTRSLLSVLGILIGVASLIAMMALGQGAQDQVKQTISSMGTNLLLVRPGSSRRGSIALESGAVTRFTLQDLAAVRERVPGVARAAGYVSGRGQAVYGRNNWNTRIDGTTADYPALRNAEPATGRFFTAAEVAGRKRVAVIGKTVAENLFGDRDPLGEFIRIQRVDFRVIGVLAEKGANGWRNEDDKIVIPLNTAMYRLLGREYIDYLDVQVEDERSMEEVSGRIRSLILALHRLPESRADSIDIRNMAELQEMMSSTTKTFSFLLGSIAFISLLVGGIGIMNIMLVSVSERTREIGLRKAIGANNGDILFQFVLESVAVCTFGGGAGILTGALISSALARLSGWTTVVAPSSVLMAFSFSLVIGLVFGIWPARKASRLDPITALRYE